MECYVKYLEELLSDAYELLDEKTMESVTLKHKIRELDIKTNNTVEPVADLTSIMMTRNGFTTNSDSVFI